MADQIPYDDPIWKLTPTEIHVAYLSLTLTKKEIASRLAMGESTVGTHLTHIFEKLGLSEFSDDEKRSLLIDNFGSTLETIALEVQEDFQSEYKRRRKVASEKKAEIEWQKQPDEIPQAQSGMRELPPEPRIQTQTAQVTGWGRRPRIALIIGGILIVLGVCGFFAINLLRGIFNQTPTNSPSPNTQTVITHTATSSIETQSPTQTSEPSQTSTFTSLPPTQTSTQAVLPTAVPLPIIERFKGPISSVWTVTGEPILTTTNFTGDYDGILTGPPGQPVAISAGNTAWSDYIIHIREYHESGYFLLGFRVQDLSNMLGIECEGMNCNWIVVKDGKKEVLSKANDISFLNEFTLTLAGENINGLTNYGGGFGEAHPFMVLPPKYQGQFLNGGVYIRFIKNQGYGLEVDYIEILPIK
jgi:hypothetical protein